ncbi:hypothetical protein GCM10022234_21920 [Aeromicrobium panaciterrae]|uniref:peptidoglycan DD-metalloendopeptidase family protein n=1 Tax=Aeromicrobium panaciterrae TaxID=363861 RepID=UPI0031DB702E
MKIWGLVIGGVAIVLLLPMLAIGAIVGAVIPAAIGASCNDSVVAMSGTWRPPLLSQYTVTSEFGIRYHPILHTTKLHTGIDLVARGDRTVVAAGDGVVKTRGYNAAYGNQVVIDHGHGVQTRYAHMAAPGRVSVGQQVGAGTNLGAQGATGYVTGAHLHFEVINDGQPINPRPFMAAQGAPITGVTSAQPASATSPAVCSSGSTYGHLRVATWNICLEFCGGGKLQPWAQRIPLIAATIKQAHPDIISLQETGVRATQGKAIINALAPTYKLAVYNKSKMVLYDPSRVSIETAKGKPLASKEFAVEGKGGVAQVLRDIRTNKTVVVSSVHPVDGANDARRLRYITRAHQLVNDLQKTQPGSVVIHAGDLNSYIPGKGNKTKVARFFADRGYRSAEQVANARKGQEYESYNGGHPSNRGARIDHIVIDPDKIGVPQWTQVLADEGESDHNMIWVEFAFAATPNAT